MLPDIIAISLKVLNNQTENFGNLGNMGRCKSLYIPFDNARGRRLRV